MLLNERRLFILIFLILFIIISLVFSNLILTNVTTISNKSATDLKSTNTEIQFKAKIIRPKYNINCRLIYADDDTFEIETAKLILSNLKKFQPSMGLIKDENFIFPKELCPLYKNLRHETMGNIVSNDDFPLAYSILLHNNVEQFERLLTAIYSPSNVYCVHIDVKAPVAVHKAVNAIVNCYDNVFVATKLEFIVYAGFSRLKAEINCLSDLLNLTNLINSQQYENLLDKKSVNWK